jgi:uncharacterized protein YacL
MVVRLTRFLGFAAGALGGFAISQLIDWSEDVLGVSETLVIILFVILGCAIGYLFGGILGREIVGWYDRLDEKLRSVAMTDLVLSIVGVTGGLLIAILAASPLRLLEPRWISFASTTVLTLLLGYGGLRVAMTKREDLSRLVERRGTLSGELADSESAMKILDTSVVIDGRLPDLLRVGAIEGRMVVPRFVVSELQTLADSMDDLKRSRGRRGLDILESMRSGSARAELFSVDYPDTPDVDTKLLRLAEDSGGVIVTVDYNLTKVARVQGVEVLNLNEVANALRPAVVTGDPMRLRIAKEGKEPGQGVGYLEDGTMVVVEKAVDLVGEEADIVVTSIFQASAGRMVFARLKENP